MVKGGDVDSEPLPQSRVGECAECLRASDDGVVDDASDGDHGEAAVLQG